MQKVGRRAGPRVNVEIPPQMYVKLKAEAARRHVSVSAVVRWAIEGYVAQPPSALPPLQKAAEVGA